LKIYQLQAQINGNSGIIQNGGVGTLFSWSCSGSFGTAAGGFCVPGTQSFWNTHRNSSIHHSPVRYCQEWIRSL